MQYKTTLALEESNGKQDNGKHLAKGFCIFQA